MRQKMKRSVKPQVAIMYSSACTEPEHGQTVVTPLSDTGNQANLITAIMLNTALQCHLVTRAGGQMSIVPLPALSSATEVTHIICFCFMLSCQATKVLLKLNSICNDFDHFL